MARITLPFFISMILFAEVGFAEGLAECPERPSDEVEARELAGSLFADGEASFQEKHFDAALAKFVCSLRMAEHENTVFNIAQIAMHVEDLESAHALLVAYVEENRTGTASVEMVKIIRELDLVLGKETELPEIAVAESNEELAADKNLDEEKPTEEDNRNRIFQITGWSSVGAGGASLLTAVLLQTAAVSAERDALRATNYERFVEERDRNKSLQTGATVGFVAAGVLGGVGLTLLLLEGKDDSPVNIELSLAPAIRIRGLSLQGRF